MNIAYAAIVSMCGIALMHVGMEAGLRLNFTDSAPHGLWIERTAAHIKRGMLVSVCPPDMPIVKSALVFGTCPETNVMPLLKTIAAIPGDTVRLRRGHAATVNGHELPNTAARDTIPAWPGGEYTVVPGQVWVFSTYNPKSFDSRYFGPVDISQIQGEAEPVLVAGVPEDMTKGVMP
jgi:conjugative transfer signal peptidase TraF